MNAKHLISREQIGFGLRARTCLAAGLVLALLAATVMLPTPPALAGDLKLNAPCDQLTTTDVTRVENPSCRAVSAIYIDENGKTLYFERLELDNERLVAGRMVKVFVGCPENDQNCGGGCGKPSCVICVGGRCGCLC